MNNQTTIKKSQIGWIIEIPDEFAEKVGIEKNSIGLLEYKDGKIDVEILPPPSEKIEEISNRLGGKYKEFFAEMKRIGD
ncbi:MAG: hypothetical protein ABI686_13485 [Acidobacteriota bacterium]